MNGVYDPGKYRPERRHATPIYRYQQEVGRMKLHVAVGFIAGCLMGATIVLMAQDMGGL